MRDKQNPQPGEDEPSTRPEDSMPQQSETPRSYYYDDATGYEIYEEESDDEEEESG
jgi:hypothetical protein